MCCHVFIDMKHQAHINKIDDLVLQAMTDRRPLQDLSNCDLYHRLDNIRNPLQVSSCYEPRHHADICISAG